MKGTFLRVTVEPGVFSSERVASFTVGEKKYSLLVDAQDLKDNLLLTQVVDENEQEAIVDLPRETFSAGRRIRVNKTDLVVTEQQNAAQ